MRHRSGAAGKERRDGFAAAFFKDLAQQPLGPAVVGSVGTYLTRIAGLEGSRSYARLVAWLVGK